MTAHPVPLSHHPAVVQLWPQFHLTLPHQITHAFFFGWHRDTFFSFSKNLVPNNIWTLLCWFFFFCKNGAQL